MFDVCTTGDMAHNMIFKFLSHTRQHQLTSVARTSILYRCVRVTHGAHIKHLQLSKKLFQFSCGCEQFHQGRSFDFSSYTVCNHGEYYEMPCIRFYVCVLLRQDFIYVYLRRAIFHSKQYFLYIHFCIVSPKNGPWLGLKDVVKLCKQ